MAKKPDLVGQKISVLMHEKVPKKQAIAMAISMGKAGRLRAGGTYVHAKKKGHKFPKAMAALARR